MKILRSRDGKAPWSAGRKCPAGPRRYRVRVSPMGKFRWNHGHFVRPEPTGSGRFCLERGDFMTEQHKEQAIQVVKSICHVLHEKRYEDLPSCVDKMEWDDTEVIRECIQGTLEMNDFDVFDEYGVSCNFKPQYEYHHEIMFFEYKDGSGFAVDYELTSGGELVYLTLQLEFLYENGGLKSVFRTIDPQ